MLISMSEILCCIKYKTNSQLCWWTLYRCFGGNAFIICKCWPSKQNSPHSVRLLGMGINLIICNNPAKCDIKILLLPNIFYFPINFILTLDWPFLFNEILVWFDHWNIPPDVRWYTESTTTFLQLFLSNKSYFVDMFGVENIA